MILAPFRKLFTFVFLDGDFNIAEDFFADAADGTSQSVYRLGRVEVEHRHEVFRAKVGIFCQTAPGQQHIGRADGSGIEECHAFVIALSISDTRDSTTSSLIRCCVVQSFPTGTLLYWEQVY